MTTLVVISPLKVVIGPKGRLVLTQKFVTGMQLYAKFWDGPLLNLCEISSSLSDNLDSVEIDDEAATFMTRCGKFTETFFRDAIPADAVVLASVGEQFNVLSRICRELGVPCIYVSEYTLKTRLQIIRENTTDVPRRLWRSVKQLQQEYAQRRALAAADGLQCNGIPTYKAYNGLARNSLLFFDTRVTGALLASSKAIARRREQSGSLNKLRLAFSGRLNAMKGVDHLPRVAFHLREMLGNRFSLSIFGDGEYAHALKDAIVQHDLGDLVQMKGVFEFSTELIPAVTSDVDLFLCCHLQGDPSCTYLETMACGVPIVGYANEAWESLSRHSGVGWITPMSDPRRMAETIAQLADHPDEITAHSIRARDFASDHTFEKTFRRRINHVLDIERSGRK